MTSLKTHSLSFQLKMLTCILSMGICLFLLGFFYLQNKNFVKTNEKYSEALVHQLEQTVVANYESLINILYYLSFQDSVQTLLTDQDKINDYETFKQVKNLLTNSLELNTHILNIVIKDSNSQQYNVYDHHYILPNLELPNSSTPTLSPLLCTEDGQQYFVLYTGIEQLEFTPTNNLIGCLYLILDLESFVSSSAQTYHQATTSLYLMDKNGTVFWCNRPDISITDLSRDIEQAFSIGSTGLFLAYSIEFEESFQELYHSQILLLLSLIFAFVLSFFILNLFIRNILFSFQKLTLFIANLQEGGLGELKNPIHLEGYSEIQTIEKEFNKMLEHVHSLTKQLFTTTSQLYEAKLAKSDAELQYLRSQINPHFLYNTLDSITGLAAMHKLPEIMNLTKSLSSIFKYSIKGANQVPLKTELHIIQNYIAIQSTRFKNRFYVEYDFDPQSLDRSIPKMILQPLVENAIQHGIENFDKLALLKISTSINENNILLITIFNEGTPMPPNKLAALQTELNRGIQTLELSNQHIGMNNVNNRLKHTYGDTYGLQIQSSHSGTIVTLRIPHVILAKENKNTEEGA